MNLSHTEAKLKAFVHDLVVGAKKLEGAADALLTDPKIAEAETAANAILNQVDPAAARAAEAGESLLAKAATAVMAAGTAADAGGVNVTLDASAVADVKAVIAAAKGNASVAAAIAAPAAS